MTTTLSDTTLPLVVKVGGRARTDVVAFVAALARAGSRFVLVHGGGDEVSNVSRRLGLEAAFEDGIRKTSAEEMPIVDMVLRGRVNAELVRTLGAAGVAAVGVSGADGRMVVSTPVSADSWTGRPVSVDPRLIEQMWVGGFVPVVSPVGVAEDGQALNVNADDVARALAMALGAGRLVFVTDVPGVLDAERRTIDEVDVPGAHRLVEAGTAKGGMVAKLRAGVEAVDAGVPEVWIGRPSEDGATFSGTVLHAEQIPAATQTPPVTTEPRVVDQAVLPRNYSTSMLLLDHGYGCRLVDAGGKAYIDLGAGIAVNALGYGRPDLAHAAAQQMRKIVHVSNLYATQPALDLAERLIEANGVFPAGTFAACHFGNSGSEANEAALKYARLYMHRTRGAGKHRVVAMESAFHGRTLGALSMTPTEKYREPYEPLVPGVQWVPLNDESALQAAVGDDVAAVIVEVVQGEGGLRVMTPEFAKTVRQAADSAGALVIVDEVQTGLGRTGPLFGSLLVDLTPDILTLSKPLAGGLPLSATLIPAKINDLLHVGDHGTTFGGGPVTTAVAAHVWDIVTTDGFLEGVAERARILDSLIKDIVTSSPIALEARGAGMLRGIVVGPDDRGNSAGDILQAVMGYARERGVLVLRSGADVLRIAPPLVIEEHDLRAAMGIVADAIAHCTAPA